MFVNVVGDMHPYESTGSSRYSNSMPRHEMSGRDPRSRMLHKRICRIQVTQERTERMGRQRHGDRRSLMRDSTRNLTSWNLHPAPVYTACGVSPYRLS